jgi:hypothetical protein
MNKLFLAVAISVCALAQAQTQAQTTSITIPNGATLSDSTGACIKQGVTGVSVSGSTISLTGGSACGGPVLTPLTVNVTFPASTYTSGNPTVSWSSTPAVSCAVSESGVATLNQTGSNPVTFDAPTAAGNYNFSINCAAPTGYTISYAPGNSSTMTVSGGGNGGGNTNTPCDPTQSSDVIGSTTLARQCTGTVSFRTSPTSYPAKADYSGNLIDLPTILSGNTLSSSFMGMLSGAPMLFSINSGAYVSFAFTPTSAGLVQFSPNSSYGEAGVISLSTRPGQFMPGNGSVICTNATGGGLYASSAAGTTCPIAANQTYYINFAGVDYNGNQFCVGGTTGTCSSVVLSYTEYTKKL